MVTLYLFVLGFVFGFVVALGLITLGRIDPDDFV